MRFGSLVFCKFELFVSVVVSHYKKIQHQSWGYHDRSRGLAGVHIVARTGVPEPRIGTWIFIRSRDPVGIVWVLGSPRASASHNNSTGAFSALPDATMVEHTSSKNGSHIPTSSYSRVHWSSGRCRLLHQMHLGRWSSGTTAPHLHQIFYHASLVLEHEPCIFFCVCVIEKRVRVYEKPKKRWH